MSRVISCVVAALLCAVLCPGFASATDFFLMWQLPPKGISLPVYVYQNGTQVAYIPSISLQIFAGSYIPPSKSNPTGGTTATYDLYYQNGSQWHGCSMVLANGSIDSSASCAGAVINPPVSQNQATSNVYTASMAALAWPTTTAPTNPTPTDYSTRTISFQNNTNYPVIQIGEACSTAVGQNSHPSCQNTPTLATIHKKAPYVVSVDEQGLNSSAFYLSSYCEASSVTACGTAPTAAQCSADSPPKGWVCTGGYFPGQTPYATKIEFTLLPVTKGVPTGASNVDVSAVDGYSLGVKLYPASQEYCTYTVPPENSNVLGAGSYNQAAPLAQLAPTSSTSLATQCAKSSQLPKGASGTKWDLSKKSTGGDFEGCTSPCAYAAAHQGTSGITAEIQDLFCCSGSYDTPAACIAGNGTLSAATSTYNTNIQGSSQFQNVYGFAYGDAGSDYACPPQTDFVVEFVSR